MQEQGLNIAGRVRTSSTTSPLEGRQDGQTRGLATSVTAAWVDSERPGRYSSEAKPFVRVARGDEWNADVRAEA
jgi:hypothetical protein